LITKDAAFLSMYALPFAYSDYENASHSYTRGGQGERESATSGPVFPHTAVVVEVLAGAVYLSEDIDPETPQCPSITCSDRGVGLLCIGAVCDSSGRCMC
jgi:hypothetical protein